MPVDEMGGGGPVSPDAPVYPFRLLFLFRLPPLLLLFSLFFPLTFPALNPERQPDSKQQSQYHWANYLVVHKPF